MSRGRESESCDECETREDKEGYPLLMGNDNRFLRLFSLFEHVSKSP